MFSCLCGLFVEKRLITQAALKLFHTAKADLKFLMFLLYAGEWRSWTLDEAKKLSRAPWLGGQVKWLQICTPSVSPNTILHTHPCLCSRPQLWLTSSTLMSSPVDYTDLSLPNFLFLTYPFNPTPTPAGIPWHSSQGSGYTNYKSLLLLSSAPPNLIT